MDADRGAAEALLVLRARGRVSIDAVRLRGGLIVRGNGSVFGAAARAGRFELEVVGDPLKGRLSAPVGILSLRGGRPRASWSSSSSSDWSLVGRPWGVGRTPRDGVVLDRLLALALAVAAALLLLLLLLLSLDVTLDPASSSGLESSSSSASRWNEAGLRRGSAPPPNGANAPDLLVVVAPKLTLEDEEEGVRLELGVESEIEDEEKAGSRFCCCCCKVLEKRL